jgi:L-amino acid N-acyltransferase YncA
MDAPLIRPATDTDLPALTEIYNHYIRETPATFDMEPWTAGQRREWFTHYDITGPHRVFVADVDGMPRAACWSSQFRPKAAYETTIETSVYCAPGWTGRGLGRASTPHCSMRSPVRTCTAPSRASPCRTTPASRSTSPSASDRLPG